jgi:cation diffusion facilitator CzcD-associated flavoprotein CzcO
MAKSNGVPTYHVSEAFFEQPRKVRVIVIGCGASGILLAYKFQKHMPDCDIIIYEKNYDIGGTWLENRYPGCACDIPSHAYQYPWAPNPNWKKFYSGSEELWNYFKDVAEKFNLLQYVKLQHRVVNAKWNEAIAKWSVSIKKDDSTVFLDESDFLINACGVLKLVSPVFWSILLG